MANKTVNNLGISLGLLGTMLIPTTIFAEQAESGNRLAVVRPTPLTTARANAQARTHDLAQADAPSYTYTLISYPGTLMTQGVGMNPGAIHLPDEKPGIEIVGAEFFPDGASQTGFRAHISETHGATDESYTPLNDPQSPSPQQPQQTYSVNDLGQSVGDYFDAAGVFHSYEVDCNDQWSCGQFKALDVPFAGATGTYSPAINNTGLIVGSWSDSAGNQHGYTLIAGKFEPFDVPGANKAENQFLLLYYGINSEGDIVGTYFDASFNTHGFLRQGKTYTTIDFPGAASTFATGINDAGDIVGAYCPTSACLTSGAGELGFLLRNGVYTTVTIPTPAPQSGSPIPESSVGLVAINNEGVLMGTYNDAAGLLYTFLATPAQ
jgi:uncharacterized membrane protein